MTLWRKFLAYLFPHRVHDPHQSAQRVQSMERVTAKATEDFRAAVSFHTITLERAKVANERATQDVSATQEVVAGLLARLDHRWRS